MNKSLVVELANGSSTGWRRVDASLSAGTWAREPPEAIPPGVGVRWANQAGDFGSEVAGSVTYEGLAQDGRLTISWANPFIGDASINVAAPDAIAHAREIRSDGDNATASVVVATVMWM